MSSVHENGSRAATSSPTRAPAPENSPFAGNLHAPLRPKLSKRPFTAVTAPPDSQLQKAAHTRPMSALTSSGNEIANTNTTFSGPLKPSVYFARPNSAAPDNASMSPAYPSHSPPFATTEQAPDDRRRPETAMLYNRPDTAQAALPPRRELPFARSFFPGSSGSNSAPHFSWPSTGMMGPPPLPARLSTELELPPLSKPTVISAPHQLPTQQPPPSWMQQQAQQPPRAPNKDYDAPGSAVHKDQENRPL
jgi:hypothetical protein